MISTEVTYSIIRLLTQNFRHRYDETEAASNAHHRLAGSHCMLVAHYHHMTQYQPRDVGPNWLLDCDTSMIGT